MVSYLTDEAKLDGVYITEKVDRKTGGFRYASADGDRVVQAAEIACDAALTIALVMFRKWRVDCILAECPLRRHTFDKPREGQNENAKVAPGVIGRNIGHAVGKRRRCFLGERPG
jgi:hypothetical protein